MSKINFHIHDVKITLLKRQFLKKFLTDLFRQENKQLGEIDYVFCSDAYLLALNQQFLKHNYYTDILTFNLAQLDEPVIGEIYISIDRIKDNVEALSLDLNEELHRVIFHGALHLCGFLDKKASDREKMTKKEDFYLSLYAEVSRGT